MTALLSRLELGDLSLAPSQVWSGVRVVPILRHGAPGDLRLGRRRYREDLMVVELDGNTSYLSYVPHALVVDWTDNGKPVAALGTNVRGKDGKTYGSFVRLAHRMAKREARNRLRLLPMHLAMEGFLARHFGGPDIAWTEYSRQALRTGLSPRSELSVPGHWIHGLADALRVFEIHDDQVGVLLFVADALASVFIVSHPGDYRELHRTLLEDFYGELMYQYGFFGAGHIDADLDTSGVQTLDDVATALATLERELATFHESMAAAVFDRPLASEHIYQCGPFSLQRFSTDLARGDDNHIGEALVRDDGTIEYLKTYRLSAAQARRAYLLDRLADNDWHLDDTAAALDQTRSQLVKRLENAGFGYLLKDDVLAAARRR